MRRLKALALCLVVAFAPFLGIGAYRIADSYEEDRALARFDDYFSHRAMALKEELSVVHEVLYATRSLFESSTEVTREEFATFTRPLRERHEVIRAIEWAPTICHDDLGAHERRGLESWRRPYRIHGLESEGLATPSPSRDVTSPVLFVEPVDGNEAAIGFDLRSEPVRREAIERSESSGGLALSDPIALVQADDSRNGFIALLHVCVRMDDADSGHEREVIGHVVLVYRAEALIEAARRRAAGGADWVRSCLRDEDVDGKVAHLACSLDLCPEGGGMEHLAEYPIDTGGQRWTLIGSPTTAFLNAHRSPQPIVLGIGATCLWLLLGASLLGISRVTRLTALRTQDRLFRNVYRSLTEGVIVADLAARHILVNETAERIIGPGSMDTPLENRSRAFGCHLPDRETPYPARDLPLARAIRGERVRDAEVFIRNEQVPDGVLLSVSSSPLLAEDGEVHGGVAVFRDVTEHRESEEMIRRLSNAVEQTADSVLIADRSGNIVYVNSAFETLTGYGRDEVLGKNPRILNSGHHGSAYFEHLWARIRRGKVFRDLMTNRRKDGRLVHVEQTITPMKDAAGRIVNFVCVSKDMTERRLLQEQEIEMKLAAQVQQHLYPKESLRVPGFDFAAEVFSADLTCGDYYDFVPLGSGRLGVVIGDVSGHGLTAALIMANTRAYLRSIAERTTDIGEILTGMNRFLSADLEDHRFVTLLIASIDTTTRKLSYANAGHIPAIVVGEDGDVRAELTRTGLPLGIRVEDRYECGQGLDLLPGDVVTMFTDGVTESRSPDGRFFETDGILDVVRKHRHAPAREIVGHIGQAIRDFSTGGSGDDDVSIVVCRVDRT